jgi:acyl-coenzyme A synthetase/AMP-(fatty) acid ligase
MSIDADQFSFVSRQDAIDYRYAGYWSDSETVPSLLARNAAEVPKRVALVDDAGNRLTYAELHELSSRLAAALAERGVNPGDVVGVQLPNRVEASVVMCAIEKAGAIVCPMVHMYRDKELGYIADKTGMKAIFVPGTFRNFDHEGLALRTAESVPTLSTVITLSEKPSDKALSTMSSLIDGSQDTTTFARPQIDPNAIAAVLFTSGTEADPKGVLHTHNTLLANNRALARVLSLGDQDGVFMASPVGHGTGYGFGLRLALFLGSKLTLLSAWEPKRAAEMISAEGSAYTHGATPFVMDLLDVPGIKSDYDLSKLRYFVSGGATIPPGLFGRIKETLGCDLLRLYGQTEGFMCTINRPGDAVDRLESTDGTALPGVELWAVDEDDRPVPPGQPGSCVYRGPHRCVGFLKDNERALRSVTSDGRFRSGDIVVIDEEGYLTVSGRRKEVINRGGYKYSPREVEDVLATHSGVLRVAVVKMADPRLGEKACAFLVLRPGESLSLEQVVAFLKEAGVAPFKWPERLETVDSLPMTASGKIQKFVLEAQLVDPVPSTPES